MKSDQQLQQDVMAELQWDPALHAAQIGVQVQGGVLTLSGEVSSYLELLTAELAAQRVAGVQAVALAMTVKRSALGLRTDADIAGSAVHALNWNQGLPVDRLRLLVEAGWVTLYGTVTWQYQREAAADSVRHLWGVRGLSNQIALEPEPATGAVPADIEAAIRRHALGGPLQLQVVVRGDEVTLSGRVPNWAEHDLALRAAWSSPGVRQVHDKLVIA